MNVVIVSPGMKHDGSTLKTESLGGSETAAVQLAEALARTKDPFGRRVNVTVFSPCERPVDVEGVNYVPIQLAERHISGADMDVLIVSRALEFLARPNSAKVCFGWFHDLALGRMADMFRGICYQMDRILLMSQYQSAQYREVYGVLEEGIEVIRNGIDLSLFPAPHSVPRQRGAMVYAARPERGLENLVREGGIMEELLKRNVPATLTVAHYDNTTEQMRPYYEHLWARCRSLPNVRLVGCLTKKQLYDLYSRSWIYCYPTPAPVAPNFAEISCISAMEAAACGLPFLTHGVGALPETVAKGCGTVLGGAGTDATSRDIFVREIQRLIRDEVAWKRMNTAAYKKAPEFTWEPVAQRLVELSDEILKEKSADPSALYKHFYRLSEIGGCRKIEEMAEGKEVPLCATEQEEVQRGWAFTESPEKYREHYELVDRPDVARGLSGATVGHYEYSENEPRWLMLRAYLRENKGKFKKVLDYGCWIGHQAIRVANELGPDAEVIGLEINESNLPLANECAEKHSLHKNVRFLRYDEMGEGEQEAPGGGEFDLVLCNEVLEHVLDPKALIDRLEGWAAEGATVFITTPSGAWEWLSYKTFPYRCHLRHYELADLQDLFREKEDVQIIWRGMQHDDRGAVIGHHFTTYTVKRGAPTGEIDWDRKLAYQAPRQTLSVCMIAKNSEDMIGRALRSVRGIADEIIVADTGSTDGTREVAARHGAIVIDGPDPLDPNNRGFEDSRNVSIAPARGSWILWIDSDEELLNPEKIHKYLRPNMLTAYGIAQHHLSVDPPMNMRPDLPMRLFRNHLGVRFYGIVHEHPELELNKGLGLGIVLADSWVAHDGYLTEDVRRKRFLRNIDLVMRDRQEYPERNLGFFLELRDLIHLCRYRMEERNGAGPPGPPDEQILEWGREAIKLYEHKFIHAPAHPMAVEALAYYSEANRILGQGVPIRFKFAVGNQPEKAFEAQFSSAQTAGKFLGDLAVQVLGMFEGRYF